MAANEPVNIVISAIDGFSPTLGKLIEIFTRAGKSGDAMKAAVDGLGGSLDGVTQRAQTAAQQSEEFGRRVLESLQTFNETTIEMQAEQAALEEEAATAHNQRLLNIGERAEKQRADISDQGFRNRIDRFTSLATVLEGNVSKNQKNIFDIEAGGWSSRIKMAESFVGLLIDAAGETKQIAQIGKSIAIATAIIDTYAAANNALRHFPPPVNFIVAAKVVAEGLKNVQKIRDTNIAHGGLDEVPADSTFLLRRGERVLTPNQNRDLTEFLEGSGDRGAGASVTVQNMEVHILENAAAGETLLQMDNAEWRQVLTDRIIPAMDELSALGIRPAFATDHV